jgi:hypothetical protein
MRKSAYAACDHGKKINAALNKPEACKSDGGICGLGGHCAECPHNKPEEAKS